jgi:hypothetical protein
LLKKNTRLFIKNARKITAPLWTGKKASLIFYKHDLIVWNKRNLIFLTTVDVTGGIGLDLQTKVKVVDENGKPVTKMGMWS